MALITNRKQIVEHPFDHAKLKETAQLLSERAQNMLGKQPQFPVHFPMGAKFPVIINDLNLTFSELEKICLEGIIFRAFDSENVTLPKPQTKKIKHELDEVDRLTIAKKLADDRLNYELVEAEKKDVMAEYKEKLDNLDAAISTGAQVYRDGFEMRDVEVEIELDFKNSARIYRDKTTGKFLESVDMEESDKQLMVDFDNLKNEPTEYEHARIGDYLDSLHGEDPKFKKGIEENLDFPHLLQVITGEHIEDFNYEDSKDRDADYKLARKQFKKLVKE